MLVSKYRTSNFEMKAKAHLSVLYLSTLWDIVLQFRVIQLYSANNSISEVKAIPLLQWRTLRYDLQVGWMEVR